MAGAACKIIIDSMIRALNEGIERVLLSPLVRDVMMPADQCDTLLQRMANIDVRTFTGCEVPTYNLNDGYREILKTMQAYGVITDEVWIFLNKGEEE